MKQGWLSRFWGMCQRRHPPIVQSSQEQAKQMMEQPGVFVLDVREQDEYDSGHIPERCFFRWERSTGKVQNGRSRTRVRRCWYTAAAATAVKVRRIV